MKSFRHDWKSLVHFLQCGTVTGNSKKPYECLGREQENQKSFPAVWDENGKSQKLSRCLVTGKPSISVKKYLGMAIPIHA